MSLDKRTTHLLVSPAASLRDPTEKLTCALLLELWVLDAAYVAVSRSEGAWQDERRFQRFSRVSSPILGQTVAPGLLLREWTVLFYMSSCDEKAMLSR